MSSNTALASGPCVRLEVSPYSISFPSPRLPLSATPSKIILSLGCAESETRSPILTTSLTAPTSPEVTSVDSQPLCTLELTLTFESLVQTHAVGQTSRTSSCHSLGEPDKQLRDPYPQWPCNAKNDLLATLSLHFRIYDSVLPEFMHDRALVSLAEIFPKLSSMTTLTDENVIAQPSIQSFYFTLGTCITFAIRMSVLPCSASNNIFCSISPSSSAISFAKPKRNDDALPCALPMTCSETAHPPCFVSAALEKETTFVFSDQSHEFLCQKQSNYDTSNDESCSSRRTSHSMMQKKSLSCQSDPNLSKQNRLGTPDAITMEPDVPTSFSEATVCHELSSALQKKFSIPEREQPAEASLSNSGDRLNRANISHQPPHLASTALTKERILSAESATEAKGLRNLNIGLKSDTYQSTQSFTHPTSSANTMSIYPHNTLHDLSTSGFSSNNLDNLGPPNEENISKSTNVLLIEPLVKSSQRIEKPLALNERPRIDIPSSFCHNGFLKEPDRMKPKLAMSGSVENFSYQKSYAPFRGEKLNHDGHQNRNIQYAQEGGNGLNYDPIEVSRKESQSFIICSGGRTSRRPSSETGMGSVSWAQTSFAESKPTAKKMPLSGSQTAFPGTDYKPEAFNGAKFDNLSTDKESSSNVGKNLRRCSSMEKKGLNGFYKGIDKCSSTYTELFPVESDKEKWDTEESITIPEDVQTIPENCPENSYDFSDGNDSGMCTGMEALSGDRSTGIVGTGFDQVEFSSWNKQPKSIFLSADSRNNGYGEISNFCEDNTKYRLNQGKPCVQEDVRSTDEDQEVDQGSSHDEVVSKRSKSDTVTDASDDSYDYKPQTRSSSDGDESSDGSEDVEDESSSDEDMTAGMVLAKRMREEYARKQRARSGESMLDPSDEKLISECSATFSYGDDDDHNESLDVCSTEWQLLKSKSIKCLRRSKSKRRVTDSLPELVEERFDYQHSIVYSEGVHQEIPVWMDLPTRRRLTFWMVDGPCEDEVEEDDDDSSCEEYVESRRKAPKKRRQSSKQNAAQLQSFVLFSCTKPGPPARVGKISPLQKTVMFPCPGRENTNTSVLPDYIQLGRPKNLKHLATENSASLMECDLKFIEDPDYIEGEDGDLDESSEGVIRSGKGGGVRDGRRLQREKILIHKSNSERVDLEFDDKEMVECQKTEPAQNFEAMAFIESDEKFSIRTGPEDVDCPEERIPLADEDDADVIAAVERRTGSDNLNSMNEPHVSFSSPVDVENGPGTTDVADGGMDGGQGFSSLSKRRRYASRSSSRSSTEEWRNLEEGKEEAKSGRDGLCHRKSFSDIMDRSIRDVVHKFRPNRSAIQVVSAFTEPETHPDESDEERLFREAVCNNQGGVTQKRLTENELKIADLELDLENAERETTRMEDMLMRWVERLEGEKADILFKKQQLEEQLILQREKDEKDQLLRESVFGGRGLPQNTKGDQNSEEIVQLRQELTEERKRANMLKRENERLLRVILSLKQELDSQMERQQNVIEMERMLKQTKEMLQCEREERHRLEQLIRDIDRGKQLRDSFASSSSSSPKKNRSGRLWW